MVVGRPLTILGGDFDLQALEVRARLAGRTLADSGIGARIGLSVLAIDNGGEVHTSPAPEAVLPAGARLVVLGDRSQRAAYEDAFG